MIGHLTMKMEAEKAAFGIAGKLIRSRRSQGAVTRHDQPEQEGGRMETMLFGILLGMVLQVLLLRLLQPTR